VTEATRTSHRVAVAAPHPLAVQAGEQIAARGGNAVDAAVAAAMTLTVVYPHMTGVGGDLFALVRRPDGSTASINASGAHGSAYGPSPESVRLPVPILGPGPVTVPGAASGWASLLEVGGSLPAAELLAPAIGHAEEGAPVCRGLALAVRELHEGSPNAPLLALLEGADLEGAMLRQPALARTLRTLAGEGLSSLYDGSLADDLARGLADLDVPVTREDLGRHRTVREEPWSVETPALRVSTAPPNSQGYLLLTLVEACGRVETPDSGLLDCDVGQLVRFFRRVEECRTAELADPDHLRSSKDELLDADRLFEVPGPSAAMARATGDTIAVTAVSTDGTAVSLIQSLFDSFGSQLLEPRTGLVLHNRGALFSADPASPNAPAPGKRPAHTLMPVLVEHSDGRISAHGAMGGRAQPQIHLQVLRHLLAGMSPQEAVSAPRLVFQDGVAQAEEGFDVLGIEAEPLPSLSDEVGHAMVSTLAPDGTLSVGIDPRSDGPFAG
jgi:gamma-glutamyltranspeptidase/glutathione hydrolase